VVGDYLRIENLLPSVPTHLNPKAQPNTPTAKRPAAVVVMPWGWSEHRTGRCVDVT
jgi:LAS superfamily LD-carboxypeptidase LdcB